MNYHIEATLDYIDKRMAELNADLYGDDTEEGDERALYNCFYNNETIEALTENRTLYKIRDMLLNGARKETTETYFHVGDHMSLHELSEKIKKAVEEAKGERQK